jgi:hypothetical protein
VIILVYVIILHLFDEMAEVILGLWRGVGMSNLCVFSVIIVVYVIILQLFDEMAEVISGLWRGVGMSF